MEKCNDDHSHDVISLVDLIVIFIKYWKMWLIIVCCGLIATFGLAYHHQSKYTFTQQIAIPSYSDTQANAQPLLSIVMVNGALMQTQEQMIRDAGKNAALETAMKVIPVGDKQTTSTSFMLSMVGTERDLQTYEQLFSNYLQALSSNTTITEQLDLWKKKINHNIENLKQISQKANAANNNGLSDLYIQQSDLESRLASANMSFQPMTGVDQSIKTVGLTVLKIIILGVFLTLLAATFLVFLIHGITTVAREVRDRLKQQ